MTSTAEPHGHDFPTRRIGLLTLPLHTNYGGILQAVALRRYLVDLGAEVVLLRRHHKQSTSGKVITYLATFLPSAIFQTVVALSKSKATRRFLGGPVFSLLGRIAVKIRHDRQRRVHDLLIARTLPQQTPLLFGKKDLARAVERFNLDTLIVGSDQVWRVCYQPADAISDYFLGFVESPAIRKIAYAASFGTGEWEAPEQVTTASRLLSHFDAISVRENSGLELCRSVFGQAGVAHTVDPTLLVDPAFYDQLSKYVECTVPPTLLQYVLDPDSDIEMFGQDVADSLGLLVKRLLLDEAAEPIDIPSWIRAFRDASFVITNSFHGVAFSIIFKKNFLAVVNGARGADRFVSLLEKLGLEDRLVNKPDLALALRHARKPIDYDAVSPRLEEWRKYSSNFLKEALA